MTTRLLLGLLVGVLLGLLVFVAINSGASERLVAAIAELNLVDFRCLLFEGAMEMMMICIEKLAECYAGKWISKSAYGVVKAGGTWA